MLHLLNRLYPVRYTAFAVSVALLVWCGFTIGAHGAAPAWAWAGLLVFGALTGVGLRDVTQTFSAVRRNYPIIGHIRFMLEKIRPEIRQYFIEERHRGHAVFALATLAWCTQRAKGETDKRPFGTQLDGV
jgi:hypothetical protein